MIFRCNAIQYLPASIKQLNVSSKFSKRTLKASMYTTISFLCCFVCFPGRRKLDLFQGSAG